MNKIIKMKNRILVKSDGILDVNPIDAPKSVNAIVVEVLAQKPYDWATKFIVYIKEGASYNEAIDAVINHSRMVASAYNAGEIDLGVTVVNTISIADMSCADEVKDYNYPIIIKK